MKESDGDAMSNKLDCPRYPQQTNSKLESEIKCYQFLHSHMETSPWLAETEFNKNVELQYTLKTKDLEKTLQDDMTQLSNYKQPGLMQVQLREFSEDIYDKGAASFSVVMGGGPEGAKTLNREEKIKKHEDNIRKRCNTFAQNYPHQLKSPKSPKKHFEY